MSTQDADQSDHYSTDNEQLYRMACAYQDAFRAYWVTTDRALQTRLLLEQSRALEQLYAALAGSLHRLVAGWAGSQQVREALATRSYYEALESIALSVFGDIANALARP